MPAPFSIELKNAREEQKRAEQNVKDLQGAPFLRAMQQATLLVERTAKKEAKVDRGMHRSKLTPDVTQVGTVTTGIVGSNLAYAPYAVLDTKPHWPPLAPLIEWVHRKGLAGSYSVTTRRRVGSKSSQYTEDRRVAFIIARKISKRGTKGDMSLIKGIEQNAPRIYTLLGNAVAEIVA
jgi:hypothetical protein